MRRRLFNFGALVSLLLCLALLVAIAASWRSHASIGWRSDRPATRQMILRGGGIFSGRMGVEMFVVTAPPGGDPSRGASDINPGWNLQRGPYTPAPGSAYAFKLYQLWNNVIPPNKFNPTTARLYGFGVRIWPVTLLAAIWPAWWMARIIKTRRQLQQGCCLNCGYDLRASPDRCPECGTVPAFASNTKLG